jgi:monoamine oxidase
MSTIDVLILGAGAAGLAAASELTANGMKIQILEARNRIGGRIWTQRDSLTNEPMELGAEFIHGHPPETFNLLSRGGINHFDVLDQHFGRLGSEFKKLEGFWDQLQGVLDKIDGHRNQDRSFADFLNDQAGKFDRETLELAIGFVEGFQAADTKLISEKSLAGGDDEATEGAEHAFRIPEGYDRVMQTLARQIKDADQVIHLNRVARAIRWSKGRVEVECKNALTGLSETFRATRLIVTLPLGVLKTAAGIEGAVSFEPEPEILRNALDSMHMGSVVRITLHFAEPIWERLADEISYLHASADAPFPIWWTALPMRRHFITAWVGGPKAEKLSRLSKEEVVEQALRGLSSILQIELEEVRSLLRSVAYHDWMGDPYSRGAYSYLAVSGTAASKRFAKPIEDTLYFAGEAMQAGEERGTVSGALKSGYRSARQIIEK